MYATDALRIKPRKKYIVRLAENLRRYWVLYLFLLPSVAGLAIFHYWPMYGIQIAFKRFLPVQGISGSAWTGLDNLMSFITSYSFPLVMRNTIYISLYSFIAGFPAPILLALLLNQIRNQKYKRVLQTITYMPNFISVVVLVGMLNVFFNTNTGLYGHLMRALNVEEPVGILSEESTFAPLYVFSGVWQGMGFGSIIYMAAIAGIDPELYEAATVDGASLLRRIWHIDLPGIRPTITITLILSMGGILGVGFEKAFLMQNNLNIYASEVISTYTYKVGLINQQYSYSAAVALFNTVINFIMLVIVNGITSRLSETSLW